MKFTLQTTRFDPSRYNLEKMYSKCFLHNVLSLLFAIGATNGTDEEVFERQRIEMLGWRRIVCNYQVNYWSTRSISGVK